MIAIGEVALKMLSLYYYFVSRTDTDSIHKLVTTPTWCLTHNYNTISFATYFNQIYYTANPKLYELFQTLKM